MDESLQISTDHWLEDARKQPSPNANARPLANAVTLLVIHNISLPPGEFGTGFAEALFCNQLDCGAHPSFAGLEGLRVSAHLLIDREGQVTQFVPFDRRAWHAGVSSYRGCQGCNDFSIGIELEGTDELPYTEAQYQALSKVTRSLLAAYPRLSLGAIVGHDEIAPGRKSDPGRAFDWQRYLRSLY
jgi:N-acetyl-anhydromuramoyl-L-alanine amidase